jgi:hypothetical protein
LGFLSLDDVTAPSIALFSLGGSIVNKTLLAGSVALLGMSSAFAAAPDYTALVPDVAGVAQAGIAAGTVMLGVLAVFWGVKKIMSLVH